MITFSISQCFSIRSLAGQLSPSGSHFATLNQYCSVDIYDVQTGRYLYSYGDDEEAGKAQRFKPSIQFFQDGCYILRGGVGTTKVFRADTHAPNTQQLSYGTCPSVRREILNTHIKMLGDFQSPSSTATSPVFVKKITVYSFWVIIYDSRKLTQSFRRAV